MTAAALFNVAEIFLASKKLANGRKKYRAQFSRSSMFLSLHGKKLIQ